MPRRTIIVPIFASLAASCLLAYAVVRAQDMPGGPEVNTGTNDPFNACLLGTCEPQRAHCVGSAAGDASRLGLCEAYLTQCLDACRSGNAGYVFPSLPERQIQLEPIPEPLLEPEPIVMPERAPERSLPPEPEPPVPVRVTEPEPRPTRQEEPEREESPAPTPTEEPEAREELSVEARENADARVQELVDEDVVRPIPGVTSVSEEGAADAEWRPSRVEPGQDVSSYVVLVGDLDDDGLPDAIEGDIPADDPTAQALSSGAPLGQPDGAGEEDPDFSVEEGEPEEGAHILRGHCDPDAICLIYIYSYIPMVLAVKTDASGNYVYDISDYVGSGSHVAYVTVTDKTGKIAKKSSPLSFFVQEAQAAEEPEALPAPDVDVEEVTPNYLMYYVLGTTVLVLIGVGLALSLRKRTP